MNRVAFMEEAADFCSKKLMEFMRLAAKKPKRLIFIFEGEDEKYYSPRIRVAVNDENWCCMNTGGRDAVLELFDAIKCNHHYKEYNFKCFIDKDFNSTESSPDAARLYITPTYSIENFYISDSFFRRALSAEFDIKEENDLSDAYDYYSQRFSEVREAFLESISTYNHWLRYNHLAHSYQKGMLKLCAKNIDISDLVNIDIVGVTTAYNRTDISSVFINTSPSDLESSILAEAEQLNSQTDKASSFRGKECAEFARLYLDLVKKDTTSKNPTIPIARKVKVRCNFNKETFLSEMSQYADTPECLITFLKTKAS